jgi:hypothetical protein
VYTAPVTIASTTGIIYIGGIHNAREPHDFTTRTGTSPLWGYTIPTIDPASTPSYNQVVAVTFNSYTGDPSAQYHSQPGDVVWCSEGVYVNPTGVPGNYFSTTEGIVVRGGYNSAFTTRDVKNTKATFHAQAWAATAVNSGINDRVLSVPNGWLDGLWGTTDTTTYQPVIALPSTGISFYAYTYSADIFSHALAAYNCHVVYTAAWPGAPGCGLSDTSYMVAGFSALRGYIYHCSLAVSITSLKYGGWRAVKPGTTAQQSPVAAANVTVHR